MAKILNSLRIALVITLFFISIILLIGESESILFMITTKIAALIYFGMFILANTVGRSNKMKKVNIGETMGIVRSIDDLGRITLPKELRRQLNVPFNGEFEIFLLKDGFYLRKK